MPEKKAKTAPVSFLVDQRRHFRARILIVDSDTSFRDACSGELRALSFNVHQAASMREGLALLDAAPGTEIVLCSYDLENRAGLGISLVDALPSMWAESRADRLPSVLLMGGREALHQPLRAEEHGSYFASKDIKEILRQIEIILLKRRTTQDQELFAIEHVGRKAGQTYCSDEELISAVHMTHRTRSASLPIALRERIIFDMLATLTQREKSFISIHDLEYNLYHSPFHVGHALRDWKFSRKSLNVSFDLIRGAIDWACTELQTDFRAQQVLQTWPSGRYDRLYVLFPGIRWLHP